MLLTYNEFLTQVETDIENAVISRKVQGWSIEDCVFRDREKQVACPLGCLPYPELPGQHEFDRISSHLVATYGIAPEHAEQFTYEYSSGFDDPDEASEEDGPAFQMGAMARKKYCKESKEVSSLVG